MVFNTGLLRYSGVMDIDTDRATELGFALISITATTTHGMTRAWKGIDWDLLGEMYERGWIHDPAGKARSVVLTAEGQVVAERLRTVHLSSVVKLQSTIRTLEEGMWRAATRFDPEWLKRHVHTEFIEFGRSGRVYQYESLFPPKATDFNCQLPLPNFKASIIERTVALVTYDSHVRYGDTVESAHRASTWISNGRCWQMRMHQGTPFSPDVQAQLQ